jgi:hypothetical protein
MSNGHPISYLDQYIRKQPLVSINKIFQLPQEKYKDIATIEYHTLALSPEVTTYSNI